MFYLGMQTHCIKSWFLTHDELFTWPLTLLAETGSKEGNSETCKGFHRETHRGRRRLQHVMWSAQNMLLKSCGSLRGDLVSSICHK